MGDPAGEQGVEEERARRAEARAVTYHPVSGVPEEFHDFLHKDCDEYKRLKAAAASGAPADAAADQLSAASLEGNAAAPPAASAAAPAADADDGKAKQPGKKKKAKTKEVLITLATRQRKKAVTSVEGLDAFGVKLADAAKVFGKKFACGASVTTNASLKDQIDIQGDVQEALPPLIVKTYGEAHAIPTAAIVMVIDKQRVVYEP